MPRSLRSLVAHAFSARSVEKFRPRVTQIVNNLVDEMLAHPRPADLVCEFSLPLSAQVIFALLGIPVSLQDDYLAWSETLMGEDKEQIAATYRTVHEYVTGLLATKRTEPCDDLISALVLSCGDRVSEQELVALCAGLLFAGHETTPHAIDVSVLTLLDHPAELSRLRADTSLIAPAVEELLRFSHQGIGIPAARVTTEEVSIGGATIPAGQVVLTVNYAANRDPAVFPDPARLNLARPVAAHLAFGAGTHYCLGAQLVRVEFQEALRALLWRLPGLRLAVPLRQLRFRQRMMLSNLHELPVTWAD
jgi:cytochrome P450